MGHEGQGEAPGRGGLTPHRRGDHDDQCPQEPREQHEPHPHHWRQEETLQPGEYYVKLPPDVAEREVIGLDPMLATGNSTAAAVETIKRAGARVVRVVSLIAAPEGIERVLRDHPEVSIVVASVDRGLNEHGFIVPGLGDAGDRLFGTA